MVLIVALNAALSLGVTLIVVAPLTWAIVAEHRDVYAVVAQRRLLLPIPTTRPTLG